MRKSIPVPFILFVIGIAFVSICLSSCGAAKNNRQKSLFLKTDHQPDFHTVHSNQLKNVMKKLNKLTSDRLPQEMDLHRIKMKHVKELSALALKIVAMAAEIPVLQEKGILNEENKKRFSGLAEKFYNDALSFQRKAETGNMQEIKKVFTTMTATCKECHSLFHATDSSLYD